MFFTVFEFCSRKQSLIASKGKCIFLCYSTAILNNFLTLHNATYDLLPKHAYVLIVFSFPS